MGGAGGVFRERKQRIWGEGGGVGMEGREGRRRIVKRG